jgi:hypothetical protein
MKDFIVNKNELAMLYGKSTSTIGVWINHGVPVVGKQGKSIQINLFEAIRSGNSALGTRFMKMPKTTVHKNRSFLETNTISGFPGRFFL